MPHYWLKDMAEGLCNILGSDDTEEQGAIPQLMAYMVSIIQEEEEHVEGTWVHRDVAYCQQAAACRNTT